MADEPKAPEPAKAPPPPAPAPAPTPAAPAAGGEKAQPPTKMILGAVGAVVAIVVLVLLVKFVIGLFSTSYSVPGVSPKLDSPENCAKTYADFKCKQAWSVYEVRMSRASDNQDYAKSLKPFYEDEKEYEKTLELGEKYIKAYKDKKGEMEKYTIEKGDEKDVEGNKAVTIKVKRKYLVAKMEKVKKKEGDREFEVDEQKDWEIKEDTVQFTVLVTQIGEEWRIKDVQGEEAIGGMWR